MQKLKQHKWFEDFNWDKLMSRSLKAPYTPEIPNFRAEVKSILAKKKRFDLDAEIEEAEESHEEEAPPDNTEMKKYRAKIPENWDEDF